MDSVPPDIAAQIDAVVASMPDVRELPALCDVPYSTISRDQFQRDLRALYDAEVDPVELGAQERLLKRLRLLPASADLRELSLDLAGGAVAAFYRPDTGAFYVIERNEPFGALDRVFVAHEYTHALQDQHFDLEGTRITDPAEGDAALAQLAVVEGDATRAMIIWAQENLTVEELREMLRSSLSSTDPQLLADMPPILSRQLTFPYEDGFNLVSTLQQQSGWAPVSDAIQHPPPSTEQIMHPDKFDTHEAPIEVSVEDVSARLGQGWSQATVQVMGELNIQVLAAGDEPPTATIPGLPVQWPHPEVWTGWGGDRLAMWEGPDGRWAIAWKTAWDTPTDADEFAGRAAELQSRFDGPTRIDSVDASQVQLLIAGDDATLQALADALGE